MSDPFNREKEISEQALDLAPGEERQRFLKTACGEDTILRARVQALLRADEAGEGFLPEQPQVSPTFVLVTEKPGDHIVFGAHLFLGEARTLIENKPAGPAAKSE